MKETLGNKIKRLRTEKGLTQDELAKLLGYSSRSTINKIESNINTISYDKLKKLVEIFNIDMNELIEDENTSNDNYTEELLDFIYQSPAAYNAIETIKRYLNKEGYIELHESNKFDIEKAKGIVIAYVKDLLVLTDGEKEFLSKLQEKVYAPELLFSNEEIIVNVKNHPAALWRVREN